jgi:co-chaperonin GroES (HSP10)
MKIKLLSDRILVKPNAIEERNSFGIILPENQKNRDESVIVAIGPKVKELKVGDTVRKFTSTWCPIYGRRGRLFDTKRRIR